MKIFVSCLEGLSYMQIAVIMAGGTGSRLDSTLPKQFLEIASRPVLIITLDKFINKLDLHRNCAVQGRRPPLYEDTAREDNDAMCNFREDLFNMVYVGVHPEYMEYTHELLCRFYGENHGIILICGGENRHDTLINIITHIQDNVNTTDKTTIITHDAARPFVTDEIIDAHIADIQKYDCCGTYTKVQDTLVYSENGNFADKTVSRQNLWYVQTPQSFNLQKLIEAIKLLNQEQINELTDSCKIMETAKIPVKIIQGDIINFKITTKEDLELAKKLY